jgi:hypothetical protein
MTGMNNISQRFSLKGWDIGKWLKGNKEAVKMIIPAVIAILVTGNVVEAGIGTIIGKAILDIVDFYVSPVKL